MNINGFEFDLVWNGTMPGAFTGDKGELLPTEMRSERSPLCNMRWSEAVPNPIKRPFCACLCGQRVMDHKVGGGWRKYAPGHGKRRGGIGKNAVNVEERRGMDT